jgi:hypothetical protein
MSVNASYGADQRRTEAPKMTRSVADVLPDGETFDAGLRKFDQGAENSRRGRGRARRGCRVVTVAAGYRLTAMTTAFGLAETAQSRGTVRPVRQ